MYWWVRFIIFGMEGMWGCDRSDIEWGVMILVSVNIFEIIIY